MYTVRRFRPIWTLALFLLLWATAAPQAFASWTCDGRVCSTGWSCCCVLPTSSQDRNCAASAGPATGAAGVCAASCACVSTVQSWDTDRSAASVAVHPPVIHVALMPPPPADLGPLPTELVARSRSLRGPPAAAGHILMPALRGPPVLTSPSIGS
jgi:hypothetical protein